jgi:hypothetical protein
MRGLIALILAAVVVLLMGLAWIFSLPETRALSIGEVGQRCKAAWRMKFKGHPARWLAVTESIFFLLLLIPLVDHALNPNTGFTAWWVWALTIGPHEIGHLICIPFGRFISVAGGSFWQIAFWFLLGGYSILVRRQVLGGLLMWQVVGHSFINLSVYIRDAQERELDLIFGLDADSHDWWNLLRWMGLLHYDDFLSDISFFVGILIALGVMVLALLFVWFAWGMPLTALGRGVRQSLNQKTAG